MATEAFFAHGVLDEFASIVSVLTNPPPDAGRGVVVVLSGVGAGGQQVLTMGHSLAWL